MHSAIRYASLAWIAIAAAGCTAPATSLQRLAQATRVAADLRVQFTKEGDAANRAVMADTDEASVRFKRDAQQALGAAQMDSATLRPLLMGLGSEAELQLLDQFDRSFATYRDLDAKILDLAVKNTNLKAQQLSFGP